MKTGNNTTRPSRRVVWPLSAALGLALLFYAAVAIIVGRTTLLFGVPEGSDAFDIVGRGALTKLSEHLGDVPLFSNKSVTLNSLLPYLRREIVYLILPDGSRLIAFHGRLAEKERKKFEDFGVWVTEIDGIVVLSDQAHDLPVWKTGLGLHLSAILPGYAGSAQLESKRHSIWIGDDGVSLWQYRSLWNYDAPSAQDFPAATIAWIPFERGLADFSSYVSELFGLGIDQSMQELLKNRSGSLLLTTDEGGFGYRLSLVGAVESQKLAQILQISVALAHPTTASRTLIDGTTIDELQTDKSAVKMSVEETSAGVTILAEGGDVRLFARQTDKETIITNREEFLDQKTGALYGLFLLPARLNDVLANSAPNTDALLSLWNNISIISISKGKYHFGW